MKSNNVKPAKAGSNSVKVPSDVSPSTNLPPMVDGELTGFLQLTVSRVLWIGHKPSSSTFVRLRWWGETTDGTYFYPRDGSSVSQKTIKTTARFPVCCSAKSFISYLKDMGKLVLEVMTVPDHFPIACARIAGIAHLSQDHPIRGFYPLMSPTSKKLGEIEVSLTLEYMTGDDTVTDPSTESTKDNAPSAHVEASQPKMSSTANGTHLIGSSITNTPRGRDHLYFQSPTKPNRDESNKNLGPTQGQCNDNQRAAHPSTKEPRHTANDVLSVISERGSKLKEAIGLSALNLNIYSADTDLPFLKDHNLPLSKPSIPLSGMLLQNILQADSNLKPPDDDAHVPACADLDVENRAMDLLLGSFDTSEVPLRGGPGNGSLSPPLSVHSSISGESEIADQPYDQSLLENLFYKAPISEITPDSGVEVRNTQSHSKNRHKRSRVGRVEEQGAPSGSHLNENPPDHSVCDDDNPTGMTLGRLSSIRVAKVTISSLTIHPNSRNTAPATTSSKGRPSEKCFYFVEYVFPVAPTTRKRLHSKVTDEVTTAVSSKFSDGVVKFQQQCVFPVQFSNATIKRWSDTDLTFKIYSRKNTQKKPALIGMATHPLRSLLQSTQLSQSVVLTAKSVQGNSETPEMGHLKVSLELAADSRSFSSEKNKNRVTLSVEPPSHAATDPQKEHSCTSQHVEIAKEEEAAVTSLADPSLEACSTYNDSTDPSPHPGMHLFPQESEQEVLKASDMLLHCLLMVPDGRNFHCEAMQPPNLYLNCKLFWSDETARSVVSWGHVDPCFNFIQVTPVTLTAKLLKRMKNNVMVIEVWRRVGMSGQDQLLGIVKLPLHHFYMSFKDPKIADILFQGQWPVLGVDSHVPVIDVLSGMCKGNLRVILAMGHSEQIYALQRARGEDCELPQLVRPVHLLDDQHYSPKKVRPVRGETLTEHLFLVRVEKVDGLAPLQSTVWGEADCFVQYAFPSQDGEAAAELDQNLVESSVNLSQFRTLTTLCMPDPMFNHSETHVILAPQGVPVQKLLLSSLSAQGFNGGGGIQFELWCRYYYPNVRDQLVAKAILPLSKLCAMVTMLKQQPSEGQKFSLPLIPRSGGPTKQQLQPSGLLDVCIRYQQRPLRLDRHSGGSASPRAVTLVVKVHRASGLQAAARALAERDEYFQYYADVGVNVYVTVQLSFAPESERKSTRIANRTFCPDFHYHMEVPCDLLVQRSSGETCSLAEQLEEASAIFTIWNRDSRNAIHIPRQRDVELGAVKIPLANLLHKTTGISGWFGVQASQDPHLSSEQHILVGGLEISMNFAHHSERQRVIKAAADLAWEVNDVDSECLDGDICHDSAEMLSLTFSMPRAWIPVHCLLLPGQTELQRSTYCYLRYKFYDQDEVRSPLKHPTLETAGDGAQATVSFQGSTSMRIGCTQHLMWYLREERLQVQVWVSFRKDKTLRPHNKDRLVGSAFVDLALLAKRLKQRTSVTGVYPLFNSSAADLQGAALRVHITSAAGHIPELIFADAEEQADNDIQEELSPEEDEEVDGVPSPSGPNPSQEERELSDSNVAAVEGAEVSEEDSFPASVVVDRATSLTLKDWPFAEESGDVPCCYVSYIAADSNVSTAVTAVRSEKPVWDHHQQCRLPKQLLIDPRQYLVFKVWHKGVVDRVIGFASVALSPLLFGLPSVCGWYVIRALSGRCHGHLKVSITPLGCLQDFKAQRKAANEDIPENPLAVSSFPSHFPVHIEQKISSPKHTDRDLEHQQRVCVHCQSSGKQEAAEALLRHHMGEVPPSTTELYSALRKNLSELGGIHRNLSSKFLTPVLPLVDETRGNSRQEKEQDEIITHQLLLQNVNACYFIDDQKPTLHTHTALPEIQTETFPSCHCVSTPPPAGHSSTQIFTHISNPATASALPGENSSPLPSPPQRTPDSHPESDVEEETTVAEQKKLDGKIEVEEEEEGVTVCRGTEEFDHNEEDEENDNEYLDHDDDLDHNDEEEDQDYEEVLVVRKQLNDMTALTDQTSLWNSVLSHSDCEDILESPDEPEARQVEEVEGVETPPTITLISHNRLAGGQRSPRNLSDSSAEVSNAEMTVDEAQRSEDEDPAAECNDDEDETEDKGSSSQTPQIASDADEASHSTQSDAALSPLPDALRLPNFFMPTHQLEESMKTVRFAPVFPLATSDPKSGRFLGSRRLPSVTMTDEKRLARIAAIFQQQ